MRHVSTTRPTPDARLRSDADLPEVIDAVNELSASLASSAVTPSQPLDAPHPSAAIVYSDAEYDAFDERLDAGSEPNEQLRRTMSRRPAPTG